MICIKTGMEKLPEYCEECQWYGTRPHPYNGWTNICELMSHCMDDDQPKEWIYDGNSRPEACPLVEMAEQERHDVAQKKRYTFGNGEFSLDAAYHDCKIVFDGITDDDSFQKADAGLVLYYANEIIYALREASQGKDTDVISRQAALALAKDIAVPAEDGTIYRHRCIDPSEILELPSAHGGGK